MELNGDEVLRRIAEGRRYFTSLHVTRRRPWREARAEYEQGGDIVLGLALIHPDWYRDCAETYKDPRGQRLFKAAREGEPCAADVFWGYLCSLPGAQVDHFFPYSLGGPTKPANGMFLCMEHNRLKGHDVHLLPWVEDMAPWLAGQIEAVSTLVEEGQ